MLLIDDYDYKFDLILTMINAVTVCGRDRLGKYGNLLHRPIHGSLSSELLLQSIQPIISLL